VAVTTHALDVAGTTRRMLVAAPRTAPSAVLLSLHGSRSSPEGQVRLSRMAPLAEEGAVVAFPEGSLRSGSGWEWDLDGDMAFLEAAVAYLRATFHATSDDLCATGMSGGARMASRFASTRADVRVLGAVAGLRAPSGGELARPVRVVAFHGTSDRINPFAGSGTARWNESVPEAVAAWARANGHTAAPARTEVSPRLTKVSYGSDDEPGAVTLWICAGAGHTWPGTRLPLALRLFLGRTAFDVDATTEIWRAATG